MNITNIFDAALNPIWPWIYNGDNGYLYFQNEKIAAEIVDIPKFSEETESVHYCKDERDINSLRFHYEENQTLSSNALEILKKCDISRWGHWHDRISNRPSLTVYRFTYCGNNTSNFYEMKNLKIFQTPNQQAHAVSYQSNYTTIGWTGRKSRPKKTQQTFFFDTEGNQISQNKFISLATTNPNNGPERISDNPFASPGC